ncbi:MAG: translation initiation factor IF-2 [Sphingomonadaceae bacterium]|nr:translation initiation factor IF-2 [Sphingomonadaceae bacterium]
MSETENKPTLGRKPLGLKKSVEAGEVKQTFSHGRTNKVVVEVKRRKLLGKAQPVEAAPEKPEQEKPAPAPEVKAPPAAKKAAAAPKETRQEIQARLLREAEEARLTSLENASKREVAARQKAVENERQRADDNRKADVEAEATATTDTEAADAVKPAAKAKAGASDPAAPEDAPAVAAQRETTAPRKFTPVAKPEPKRPDAGAKRPDSSSSKKSERSRGDRNDRRQSGKLTVTRALNEDEGARARSLAALKRAREKERRAQFAGKQKPRVKHARDVIVPEAITVAELAKRMGEKGADLVKALFNLDMMVTITETIDADTAELLVEEFGHRIERVSESDIDLDTSVDVDPEETLKERPPVVTIMGHVDHGKTSLLDALRGTDVVKGEAGGITQHIGAYQVTTKDKNKLTFLDTPGHEAFTQMRMRGANVTDIVILVVAADDGIMPQTIEAIKHTKAAGVPMIVAINKCDKDDANAQRVRERLLEHEIVVEEMSGEVQNVEVSAKTGKGIDELIEKIMLQAELLELKANPDRNADATVIEAKLDKGKGPLATVLVNRGTLRRGDIFVVGTESSRVRALHDDKGKQIKEAGPSTPVEVLGLGGVPNAGDQLTVVENEQRAREVAEYRQEQATEKRTAPAPANLETMFTALAEKAHVIEFPLVIKADVQGSIEAINTALNNLSNDDIKVRILQSGVGAITESDVALASATGAPILGFNVRPNAKARELISRNKTRMMYYDVIYQLTEEIAKEMAGELGPEKIEHVVGRAEVKEVFRSGKKDKAAGLLVTEGTIRKGLFARLTREDVIVSATTIASLRRFKDDVDEVRSGLECGVVLEDTNDIKPGDSLEVFEIEERERVL